MYNCIIPCIATRHGSADLKEVLCNVQMYMYMYIHARVNSPTAKNVLATLTNKAKIP